MFAYCHANRNEVYQNENNKYEGTVIVMTVEFVTVYWLDRLEILMPITFFTGRSYMLE